MKGRKFLMTLIFLCLALFLSAGFFAGGARADNAVGSSGTPWNGSSDADRNDNGGNTWIVADDNKHVYISFPNQYSAISTSTPIVSICPDYFNVNVTNEINLNAYNDIKFTIGSEADDEFRFKNDTGSTFMTIDYNNGINAYRNLYMNNYNISEVGNLSVDNSLAVDTNGSTGNTTGTGVLNVSNNSAIIGVTNAGGHINGVTSTSTSTTITGGTSSTSWTLSDTGAVLHDSVNGDTPLPWIIKAMDGSPVT